MAGSTDQVKSTDRDANPVPEASKAEAGNAEASAVRPGYPALTAPNKFNCLKLPDFSFDKSEYAFYENSKEAHRYLKRVTEQPALNPDDDPTIAEIEEKKEEQIIRILEAMKNRKDVRGGPKAPGIEWATPGSDFWDPKLLEAKAREIVDQLLYRVKRGYRGIDRPRALHRGHHVLMGWDKMCNCRTRLHNIVEALKYDKSILRSTIVDGRYAVYDLVHTPLTMAEVRIEYDRGNARRKKRNEELKEINKKLMESKKAKAEAMDSEDRNTTLDVEDSCADRDGHSAKRQKLNPKKCVPEKMYLAGTPVKPQELDSDTSMTSSTGDETSDDDKKPNIAATVEEKSKAKKTLKAVATSAETSKAEKKAKTLATGAETSKDPKTPKTVETDDDNSKAGKTPATDKQASGKSKKSKKKTKHAERVSEMKG